MGTTVHTPPIDLYEETDEQDVHDDREVSFGFAFPDQNGDREEEQIADGEERLHAVLGW